MDKHIAVIFVAISGALLVALGAFGAHVLAAGIGELRMSWLETGLRYQAWHSLAMLGIAALGGQQLPLWWRRSLAMFGLGIVLFSGSLYGLALSQLRFFVFITPCGGIFLLLGWLFMLFGALRRSTKAGSHE